MNITIQPITQFNSFVKAPTGRYLADTCIKHNSYTPAHGFEEADILIITEKLKELLQYFKGEHTIYIYKLIRCKPYEWKHDARENGTQRLEIESEKEHISVSVLNPKSPKVTAYSGSSFGEHGWFLKAEFGIEGISNYSFGSIYPSYKWVKDTWADKIKSEEEISHWKLEEIRKKKTVKCNICKKKIINLEAEQCSKCGRFFCKECLNDSVCNDCQGDD
jgi:hypothetical protein